MDNMGSLSIQIYIHVSDVVVTYDSRRLKLIEWLVDGNFTSTCKLIDHQRCKLHVAVCNVSKNLVRHTPCSITSMYTYSGVFNLFMTLSSLLALGHSRSY